MNKLLQAHVHAPEPITSTIDEIFETMLELGFVIVDDGDLADEAWELRHPPVDMELSSLLFEERADNLELLEMLYEQVIEAFPDANVFKYRHSLEFSDAGRSVSDPSEHIIIQVSNQGVDRPCVRWRQKVNPLGQSPRGEQGRVFHANGNEVLALDGTTGEILWRDSFDRITSVPEAGGDLVTAAGWWAIRAYDAGTGKLRWERKSEEHLESEILDARLEVGDNTVFAGTRGGDVIAIDAETGTDSVIQSFDDRITQLLRTADGLVVQTGNGELHALDPNYSITWTTQRVPGVIAAREGTLYCNASGKLLARSLDAGSEVWSQQIDYVRNVTLGVDDLFVISNAGLQRIDAENGAVVWTCDILAEDIGNEFRGSIQLPSKQVLAVDRKSVVHILDNESGVQRSRFTFGGETFTPVAVGDGAVFVSGPELIRLEEFPED
jgi:outer membrane protein assembly factor BamB